MKNLNYSRPDLPVVCPEDENANMDETFISRDSYTENLQCFCSICHSSYNVTITED